MSKHRRFQLVVLGSLLLAWEAVAEFWPPGVVPSPVGVALALWRETADGELPSAAGITLLCSMPGFLLGAAAGLGLGVTWARWHPFETVVGPLMPGLRILPAMAWMPLLLAWQVRHEHAILFAAVVGGLFPVASATRSAIRTIPREFLHAATTMGAQGMALYQRVVLPAAWPWLLVGLRSGWTFAWRSLLVAELLLQSRGLGALLGRVQESGDVEAGLATVLVILALGLLVDRLLFARIQRSLEQRWGPGMISV